MFDRSQLTLEIVTVTLVLVLVIAVLMVLRGGRSAEAKGIIDAVRKVDKNVEGMRQQMGVEHQALEYDNKTLKGWLLRILHRFGFLE